jgi:hypothetical protein
LCIGDDSAATVTEQKEIENEGENTTFYTSSMIIIFTGPMNILLIFIPVAIICWIVNAPDVATFIFSLLSMVPLAERLGISIDKCI